MTSSRMACRYSSLANTPRAARNQRLGSGLILVSMTNFTELIKTRLGLPFLCTSAPYLYMYICPRPKCGSTKLLAANCVAWQQYWKAWSQSCCTWKHLKGNLTIKYREFYQSNISKEVAKTPISSWILWITTLPAGSKTPPS